MQREEPGELLPGDDIAIAGIDHDTTQIPGIHGPVPTEWNIRETSQRETHVHGSWQSQRAELYVPGKLPTSNSGSEIWE